MRDLEEYICSWFMDNLDMLEQDTGCKIKKSTLKRCPGGLKAKEVITERIVFVNIHTRPLRTSDLAEMILYSAVYEASVIVLAAPRISITTEQTVK